MKTQKCSCWLGRLAALIVFAPLAAPAAETATAPAADPTGGSASYVVFTATDIQVQHMDALHRLRGVEDRAFAIQTGGQKVLIPMGSAPAKVKLTQAQLLTERVATVAHFKYDRVYTPATDPRLKFIQQMKGLDAMKESVRGLEAKANATPDTIQSIDSSTGAVRTIPNPHYAANAHAAQLAGSQSAASMDERFYTERLEDELAQKLFDALEVRFEVSSAKRIPQPYVVLMAKYRAKEDAAGQLRNWFFAQALPPIDATAGKVSIRETGFPPGFEVESLQIHLYENGVEIATNLSEKRAALTRDEAHEYLVFAYLTTHKHATRPPQVALLDLPDDWAARRHDAVFRPTYFVKVDSTGRAAGVFEDESCTVPVADPSCAAILSRLRFVPALEKGQPVDGVSRVTLATLTK